jgi:hypothetical protein
MNRCAATSRRAIEFFRQNRHPYLALRRYDQAVEPIRMGIAEWCSVGGESASARIEAEQETGAESGHDSGRRDDLLQLVGVPEPLFYAVHSLVTERVKQLKLDRKVWHLMSLCLMIVPLSPTESIKESLPPAFDAALAWTVREGVTNVIRHSCARHCRIHLTHKHGMVGAEVLNDGGERGREENRAGQGLGLVGLRERVCTLGGYLEAGPCMLQGKEHFRLAVELPLQSQGDAKVFQEE